MVKEGIGEIETRLTANDWLLCSHAEAFDAGRAPDTLAALVKHEVIDHSVAAVEAALNLAGSHGLERHHRNVLCGRIHAPPNSLIRTSAGRAVLGV